MLQTSALELSAADVVADQNVPKFCEKEKGCPAGKGLNALVSTRL
jgi:hypothetical protein